MFALLHRAGITDRDDRLTLTGAILHRPVTSTKDLTDIEIRGVVDTLLVICALVIVIGEVTNKP